LPGQNAAHRYTAAQGSASARWPQGRLLALRSALGRYSTAMARVLKGSGPIGLAIGKVTVTASNPDWPVVFDQLAAEIRVVLANIPAVIEHVGSTAVPGLAAKPIIDIAIGVKAHIEPSHLIEALSPLGYIYRRDDGDAGGQLFVLDGDQPGHRIAYVHVVTTADPQWHRYLAVRDRLRQDPAAKAAYDRLKRDLAEQFPDDRAAYTRAKESFIRGLPR
jgi:GrpB-like predicted nucleotidyltransferase (UPF0157 family)